jgi:rod shape-determining protein MreC
MSAVFANRTARRRTIAYVGVVTATLLMMAVSANPFVVDLQHGLKFAFKPVQQSINGLGLGISSIAGAIGEIDQLRLDNDALRAENQRIQELAQQADEIKRQNEVLTGLLQLRNGFDYKTSAATVIARDSSEVQQRITLDRGTGDGVAIGNVVISSGGALVGRVIDASSSTSTVQLISDSGSTVVGQLITSVATGEVTGQQPGSLLMENIDAAVTVGLGEEVVTAGIELASGIRSPYPKGLVIGTVIDVSRDANQVVQTAYLEPAADLEHLEYVLVILDYQGGLPAPGDQPQNCQPNSDGTIPAGEQPCIEASPSPSP